MKDEPSGVRLGLGFWLLIVFALACILAGLGVAKLGPRLFPAEPAAAAAPRT
jgi:hypothetical protein